MAKKTATATSSIMSALRKQLGSTDLLNSTYADVKEYISTGMYSLNKIISGSFYKGVPSGRIMIFFGESQAGKTLVSACVAGNAIKENGYDCVFILDSEGGVSKKMFDIVKPDLSRIEHVLVESIEDCTVKSRQILDAITEEQKTNPKYKALIILDSLGGLVTNKAIVDVQGGTPKVDRGMRARLCNDMVKGWTVPALKTDTAIIVLNHVYDDPAAMYVSKIKNQSGGKGVQYMSRLQLQCTRSFDKNLEKEDAGTGHYKSTTLHVMCTKNNIVRPFFEAHITVDYATGPNKYSGLFDLCEKYGLITCPSQGFYQVKELFGEKKMRRADIDTPEVFDKLLPKLEELSKKDIEYGNGEVPVDDSETEEVPTEHVNLPEAL